MKPVATEWFQHERLAPDLIRITEKHFDPIARANLWLLTGRDRHLLIDTGLGVSDLARYLAPRLVHPGHYHSFGTERLHSLVTDYLAGRRASACPASA